MEKPDNLVPFEEFKRRREEKEQKGKEIPRDDRANQEKGKVISFEEFKNAKSREVLKKFLNLPDEASDDDIIEEMEARRRDIVGFPPEWTEEDIEKAIKKLEFKKGDSSTPQ